MIRKSYHYRIFCVKIVLAALNQLNREEVSQKHSFDLIIRLVGDLQKFNEYQLIELVEFCMDSMRLGDPKCVGFVYILNKSEFNKV